MTCLRSSHWAEGVFELSNRMKSVFRAASFLLLLLATISTNAQQTPGSPQAPVPPATAAPPPPVEHKANTKPVPSFLIIGTVFNEHALSFPGVLVRVRRAGENKFQWQTYTNSRGEFAVRVPPGFDYEVVAHEKKYKDQTKIVDSRLDVQQRLSIRLELIHPPKTGAKS